MTATDNLPQGGTDSAQPSTSIDDPANWNFDDPDDEQDNAKPKEATGTDVEKAENAPAEDQDEDVQEATTDEQQEDPDAEATAKDDKQAEKPAPTLDDDVKVKLKSGEEVTLRELRDGFMRQSDYTRKRQVDEQRATHIRAVSDRIQNYLQTQIPPLPDQRLAWENPTAYAAQLAQHDAAKRHWSEVVAIADEAKQVAETFTAEQRAEMIQTEYSRLVERMPELATQKGREAFRNKIKPAAEYLGVPMEEVDNITLHTHLIALDLVAEGLAARKAKQIAKQKVQNVPPVAPAKRQAAQTPKAIKNADAMKRLSKSGSIYDAMNVDFD